MRRPRAIPGQQADRGGHAGREARPPSWWRRRPGRRRRAPRPTQGGVDHPVHRGGNLLSVDEIGALADWAHHADMWLHLDGARLSNACRLPRGGARGVRVGRPGSTSSPTGGPRTEPWVPRPWSRSCRRTTDALRYIRKQSMQLASKMRFIAAQFIALLTDDLWRTECPACQRHGPATGRRGVAGPGGHVGLSGRGQRGVRRRSRRR